MPDEYDEIEDILSAFGTDDVKAHSKFERQTIGAPTVGEDGRIRVTAAFNNPGSGTKSVTQIITPEGHIVDGSIRAHSTREPQEAGVTYADGTESSGPKFVPGEVRRRKKMGLTAEKLKATLWKLADMRDLVARMVDIGMGFQDKAHLYVTPELEGGKIFLLKGGELRQHLVLVWSFDLYAEVCDDPSLMAFSLQLDGNEGFARGGVGIDVSYLQKAISAVAKKSGENA